MFGKTKQLPPTTLLKPDRPAGPVFVEFRGATMDYDDEGKLIDIVPRETVVITRKKVREGLRLCVAKDSIGKFAEPGCLHCPYNGRFCQHRLMKECLEMLDEPDSTLGMKITAAGGITFTAAGDAADGERRGIVIGKVAMYEKIFMDLYMAGLLSKEIRNILTGAKDDLIGKAGDDDESGT